MTVTQQPQELQRARMATPAEIKSSLPLEEATRKSIQLNRHAVSRLLSSPGSDDRLLVIVGPCSIHDPKAALEYAERLSQASERYQSDLLIVMRVYVEKPRSTIGWKGLIHDPNYGQTLPPSSHRPVKDDFDKGVHASRKIMLDVASLGLPIATELLSPLLVIFFQDVVSLGVVGARTTESQTHREMASEMPFPTGFKNSTDGSIKTASDAIQAAIRPHTVVGIDDEGRLNSRVSLGNPNSFVILRGGSRGPNFRPDDVRNAETEMLRAGVASRLVVDCSHGNSMKDYRNQGSVASCLAEQVAAGAPIAGVMLESNIHEGRQDVPENKVSEVSEALKYGVSITDGCIGWEETKSVLYLLAHAVRQRRSLMSSDTQVSDPLISSITRLDNEKTQVTVRAEELAVELV